MELKHLQRWAMGCPKRSRIPWGSRPPRVLRVRAPGPVAAVPSGTHVPPSSWDSKLKMPPGQGALGAWHACPAPGICSEGPPRFPGGDGLTFSKHMGVANDPRHSSVNHWKGFAGIPLEKRWSLRFQGQTVIFTTPPNKCSMLR